LSSTGQPGRTPWYPPGPAQYPPGPAQYPPGPQPQPGPGYPPGGLPGPRRPPAVNPGHPPEAYPGHPPEAYPGHPPEAYPGHPPEAYPGYRPAPTPAPDGPGPEWRPRHQLARTRYRRRQLLVAVCLLVALTLVAVDLARGWPGGRDLLGLVGGRPGPSTTAPDPAGSRAAAGPPGAAGASGAGTAAPSGSGAPAGPSAVPSVAVPQTGPGTFAFASGPGPTLGSGGAVRRFRVAVENGTNQDPAAFAAAAEQILGDQRSWIAGGDVRFQRVAQSSPFEFTLYLASPGTTDKLCAIGGLHTEQFVSCRLPGQVIINLARWLTGVPDYGASLDVYRQWAVNHEVGRELGHGNEACPAPGVLAPVMQQQSLGLRGCVANAWPYVNGQLYEGTALP
jgi:Protein of unknown function (DUF3152)